MNLQIALITVLLAAPAFGQTATNPDFQAETTGHAFEPAPMPNADIYAPLPQTGDPHAAQFSPRLFQPNTQFRGDGFSPGSTAQGAEMGRVFPAPGVSVKVPLD